MTTEPKYQSKMVNALDGLLQQWDERLSKTPGWWGGLWMGLRPEVPSLLQMLDEDLGAQEEIARFAIELAKEIEGEFSGTPETG